MKIHRFIGDFAFAEPSVSITDPALVHQLGRVLRLRIGESVVLCDGKGQEIEGEITFLDKKRVAVTIHKRYTSLAEPSIKLTLYLALIKRENFELAVQKAVEVGVSEVVPLITQRTVKQTLNLERIRSISREAAEQSGRGIAPFIHEPLSFESACQKNAKSHEQVFFFDLDTPLFDRSCYVLRDTCHMFIGPEGGWTDTERTIAKSQGFATVGLGPRILRAETAAIVASYVLSK